MKKKIYILGLGAMAVLSACTKSDFEEAYVNPATLENATLEKQFSGMLYTNREYVLPAYWDYFVVLRTTLTHYTQAVGWVNAAGQYVPGEAGIGARWSNFYSFLAQFKELDKIYAEMTPENQADFKIFKIAATISYYDHSQKVIDLHGDIPWTQAGQLSANNGDYTKSYPAYDKAQDIYVKMLDDLKAYADEMSTMTVKSGVLSIFKNQDLVGRGDLATWRRYCNSLRLRMLSRVSDVASLKSRADAEIAAIFADPVKYPVISQISENVWIKVHDLSTPINSTGFRSGLEDWNGNLAGKKMMDFMNTNVDPRQRVMFEPGLNAAGVYIGLDPLAKSSDQDALVAGGTIAIYNRSTLSRNQYFPGTLITAPEVSFWKAEHLIKKGDVAGAKAAYENGIKQSIDHYYYLRTLSNDNTVAAPTAPTSTEVNNYLASAGVKFDNATTSADRMKLVATQKWIHLSVVQMPESWAEIRRLNAPTFSFEVDNSNPQSTPPNRWIYPSAEPSYNTANYEAVRANDKLSTKIFWDVN